MAYLVIAFMLFMLAFATLLLFVITSAFLGFLMTRVPFVPTSAADIKFIANKLRISSADTFYDLGSGDGKACFLVNKLSGAYCVGFELTWWTHLLAKLKAIGIRDKGKVQFKNQNFFKHSWAEANYIYGYLYPPLMGRVEQKFLEDCKPGSIAIIRDFPFPRLKPKEIIYRPHKHEIYIYQK